MDYTRNYHSIPNDMNRYKMETNSEFGIRKTILVLGVVAICFALLWPKLFSPMLNSSVKPLNPEFQGSAQIKQERRPPSHAGGLHPALRERGQAIPASHVVPKIENRQETTILQNMRPPMGGAGRVVPPQAGSGSMGIIMPLYTFGILIFFIYTIAKIVRKNSNNVIYAEYSHPEAEREFRDRVFNPELLTTAITGMPYYNKESSPIPNKRAPTIDELKQQDPGEIEVDQLIQRLADTEAAMERIVVQMGNLSRTVVHNSSSQPETQGECTGKSCCNIDKHEVEDTDDSSPTVLIMGMETTASCEGGQKISRPSTPVISHSPNLIEREPTPPKPIYLEGALPAQCELLVTDSETQAENTQENAEAPVVLSGKMTLSLISLENSADSEDAKGEVHCQEKPEILSETNELEEISRTDVRTDKDVDYNVDSIKIPESRQIEDNEDNINNSKTDKNVHDFDGNIIRDNENEEEEEEEEEDDVDEDNDYQDEEEEVIENKQSGIEDNSEEKLSNTSQ
ncbi:mediator of RNA polymerase II transcription subunit 13 isoform X4 [Chelonus insularis]|uniref:mediator of RNA polymerase II transcription subunit 13 isoform X4 n=1 Tax=Chelonus insularis TaxID=460826 RepID=UPI00158C5936|nr:mediator of RNA polymerase II transcription subunit 13 isoform X4 [Chelonus insularis]